jgi:hypothetical protein
VFALAAITEKKEAGFRLLGEAGPYNSARGG